MIVRSVHITPLERAGLYGQEVDVSDYVNIGGLAKIKQSLDSTDYSVGVFRFSDLRIRGQNGSGKFNENDSRSIFPYLRDAAKVRVEATQIDEETGEATGTILYKGLLNEEATRINITTNEISFLVLSLDSVLRTASIPVASVTNGLDVRTVLFLILSQTEITDVLNVNFSDINPNLNFIVDKGEEFDNLKANEAINTLLLASNSTMTITEGGDIIIKSRLEDDTNPPLELGGAGAQDGESNIVSISSYNSGRQRQFNAARMNNKLTVQDRAHVAEYGLRIQNFNFPYVTNTDTLTTIGQRFVDEFKFPKIELKLRIPSPVLAGRRLLDLVRIDAPWIKKRALGFEATGSLKAVLGSAILGQMILGQPAGAVLGQMVLGVGVLGQPNRIYIDSVRKEVQKFFPVLGGTVLGDSRASLPVIVGSVQIERHLKFKIISIEEDPKSFITTLKLRQTGTSSNDGIYL